MSDVTHLLRQPRSMARALISMQGIMLLLSVVAVATFNLHPAVKLALVTLALSPVPPILPERALHAGARQDYTIGLLVGAALAAIVLIPPSMEILELAFGMPLRMKILSTAGVTVSNILLPLAIGVALRRFWPQLAERVAVPVDRVAVVLLAAGALIALFATYRHILVLIGNGTILAFVAFCVIGVSVGHFFGRKEGENQVVLALATATRHPGMALAIAQANFPEHHLVTAALVIFVFVNAVVSALYLARRVPGRFERRRHV